MSSIPKVRLYPIHSEKYDYHARILATVCSDIGSTQVQFISNETKSNYWSNEDLTAVFNNALVNIKRLVETGGYINIFDENLFFDEKENITIAGNEVIEIEIPEDKATFQRLKDGLMLIEECRDKLFNVISWPPEILKYNYSNITIVIDYMYQVVNSSVVDASNKRYLHNIRSAFDELKERKNSQHHNYLTTLNLAKNDIYTLEFPKFFKSTLPRNDIKNVLDEIR